MRRVILCSARFLLGASQAINNGLFLGPNLSVLLFNKRRCEAARLSLGIFTPGLALALAGLVKSEVSATVTFLCAFQ